MIFLISTIMLFSILSTKFFFVFFAKGSDPSTFELASIAILSLILASGLTEFLKNLKKENGKNLPARKNTISTSFLVFTLLFVLGSVFINLSKNAVLWDAVALYDARAKFLIQDTNFSQMVELSKYDPQNSYYYLLYPPHTSVLHYFWYKMGIAAPVSVLYSVWLVFLAIAVFIFTKKRLGYFAASLLTFLTVSNGTILSSSLHEYTNLPFTAQMLLGVILIYEYLEDQHKWKLIYGTGLIVTTMWIRFLEPLWAGAVLALFVSLYLKKRFAKELLFPLMVFIYGILEYISWQSFVSNFGEANNIVSFNFLNFLEPVVGIYTGSFVNVFIFFVTSWGIIILVHSYAIYLAILEKKPMSFLQLSLLFTIVIYFSGLYFVSFQSDWWHELGDSLVRGSSFMIPISAFIILKYLSDKKT